MDPFKINKSEKTDADMAFSLLKPWRMDKAYPNQPLLPGDYAFGAFQRPHISHICIACDDICHMSPFTNLLLLCSLFYLVLYAYENKLEWASIFVV